MGLLSTEEHKTFVEDYGFKKVGSRCPVCYVDAIIEQKVKKAIKKHTAQISYLGESVMSTDYIGLLRELGLED